MTALRGAGTQMGRGSAGPRARTITREDVLARQAKLRQLPKSDARSRGLAACRSLLQAIAKRVQS